MKILDVLYNFYGDFDFIEEKYNEKYEGRYSYQYKGRARV